MAFSSFGAIALLDVPHPDDSWLQLPILPPEGSVGPKIDAAHPAFGWWWAFHQSAPSGPIAEQLLAGDEMRKYVAYLYNYLTVDNAKFTPLDMAVFGDRYSSPERIRAGHSWYSAWPTDIRERRSYPMVTMPVMGLGARVSGYQWLKKMTAQASDFRLVEVPNSGHFVSMEQPGFVSDQLRAFFRS